MKHKWKLIIVFSVEFIAIAVMMLFIFFAGKKVYTVTFDLNGGTLLSGDLVQKVTQGHSASAPKATKEGCYFLEWSGSYREVTRDLTIKAVWEYETTEGIEYSVDEGVDSNYCEIVGCYKELAGDVYIGAYYGNKKVLGIKAGAFENCTEITSIHLLDGILTIEENAFRGCTALETIEIPSTVRRIGDNAFAGCTALTEVVLPEELKYLGSKVFDTPELIVYANALEEEKPQTWAVDWCSHAVTVEWGKYKDILAEREEEAQTQKKK
ncbi:MAG: hypothetical protein E7381_02145 [Clostridiales bacterium]|nr:hypothetical protein [Clostridiales bacterium]